MNIYVFAEATEKQLSCFFNPTRNMELSVLIFKKDLLRVPYTDKMYGTSWVTRIAMAPRGKIITHTHYLNASTDLQHALKVTSDHNRPVSLFTTF